MWRTSMRSDPLPPIRACIFDVDGLLINSEDIYTEIYNNVLKSYNKPPLPWHIKAKQQSRGREGTQKILDWAHLPISIEEWGTQCAEHYELFKKSIPLPGVTALLDTLSSRTDPAVRLAIASSASSKSFELKTGNLSNITSPIPTKFRIFGDDPAMTDARKKPAPDLYLMALERLNAQLGQEESEIKPKQCLVFEDSVAGVQAGRRAGMRVCWVPHQGLRDVYRGKERKVLMGESHEEDVDTPLEEDKGEEEPDVSSHIWSEDGWAEMRLSLEGFDYGGYGIELKRMESREACQPYQAA